jgi:O-antigen/teichoic acid export membrane protein
MYGVLDYVAQPAAMLLAAPILLHRLGVASYGVWLIASAAVGAGSIVSSGFGDAVIQRVAALRASGDVAGIRQVVANLLSINLLLSAALAILLWAAVPWVTGRVTHFDPTLRESCAWSLRIGALLMMLKSIESVFICGQRALEKYGPAVRRTIATRLLTTLAAVGLAWRGHGVPALMVATAGLTMLGAAVQGAALKRHLGGGSFKPEFDRATLVELGSFGGFTWLQAVSGVLFSQADRLLLGTVLGASSVSYYGICMQMAQPIHGLTAAGLHFLFPHLALRFASGKLAALRRPVYAAMAINAVLATVFAAGLMLIGPKLLRLWMGGSFADHADGCSGGGLRPACTQCDWALRNAGAGQSTVGHRVQRRRRGRDADGDGRLDSESRRERRGLGQALLRPSHLPPLRAAAALLAERTGGEVARLP